MKSSSHPFFKMRPRSKDTDQVTVLIPTYNMGDHLPAAVSSVFRQTHQNIELIIVDDGSADDTDIVVASLESKRMAIKYVSKPNGGRSSAINKGITFSTSDYITLLDADDRLPVDSIEHRLAWMKEHPTYDAVFADLGYLDRKDHMVSVRSYTGAVDERMLADRFLSSPMIPFHPITFMYQRRVFADLVGDFDESKLRGQDIDYAVRLLQNGKVGYLPQTCYEYAMESHSMKTRLKNRVRCMRSKQRIVLEHKTGADRYISFARLTGFEMLKLGYEIFSGSK